MLKVAKHYKLIHEHPGSFELHDSRDGRSFHVAKRGLDKDALASMAKVQKFAEGGQVGDDIPFDTLIPQEQAQQAQDNAPYGTPPIAPAPPIADTGVALASNGPVTPDQVAALPVHTPAAIPGDGAPQAQDSNPLVGIDTQKVDSLDSMEKGLKNAMATETAAHAGSSKAWKEFSDKTSQMETPEAIMTRMKKSDEDAMKAYQSKTINPDRYWANKGTGQRIAAGIGMILGGFASGANGGPNMAVETINKAIDRDIDAQKDEQSKSMNLWKMNREATQNDLQANLMTRNQMLTAVEAKTKMFAEQAGGAEAQLKFAPLLLDIQKQKQENYIRLGLMKGGVSETDPAQLVGTLVKDPEMQRKVYGEIQAAQNTNHMAQSILKNFEDSVKENTIMKTGAGYLRTPASVLGLHQALQPTFADLEGTVRQAAMDNTFKNVTPSPGDSEHTIQQKRDTLQHYLQSKSSAPIAKGSGLDLNKFRSTMPYSPAAQPQTQTMNGVQYVKVPGGWKRAG